MRNEDFISRFSSLEEKVRLEKIRRKGHTETKTFIIGGDIYFDLYIPPFFIGVNADGDTPEFKYIHGFRGKVKVGNVSLEWQHVSAETTEMTVVATQESITSTGTSDIVTSTLLPFKVADGDYLQPVIIDAFGPASDLAAAVIFTTGIK
jgi:hypothetical protein